MAIPTSTLVQCAQKHASLMVALAPTDPVPSALSATSTRLAEAEDEVGKKQEQLKELAKKRTSDYKTLDSLRSSSARRLFFRFSHGGREALQQRMEKDEQEYQQTTKSEHETMRDIEALKVRVAELTNEKLELERRMEERRGILGQLDELYEEAFSATAEYPEELAAREACAHAQKLTDERRSAVEPLQVVVSLLSKAGISALDASESYLKMKKQIMKESMGSQDMLYDIRATSHKPLRDLQAAVKNANSLLAQAREQDSTIPQLPPCDNITTLDIERYEMEISSFQDPSAERTLEKAFKSYHAFQENIKRHFDERSGLLKSANQSAKEAQEHARRCQAELTAIRRDILVNIAEAWRGEVLPDYIAPPSYRSGSSNEGITP